MQEIMQTRRVRLALVSFLELQQLEVISCLSQFYRSLFGSRKKTDKKKEQKSRKQKKTQKPKTLKGAEISESKSLPLWKCRNMDFAHLKLLSPQHLHSLNIQSRSTHLYFSFGEDNSQVLTVNRTLTDRSLQHFKPQEIDQQLNLSEYFSQVGIQCMQDQVSIMRRQAQILNKIRGDKDAKLLLEQRTFQIQFKQALQLSFVTLILCHGGNFSIASFQDGKCLKHRSDHAYVCRGTGGRQATKDKQKKISSMGSQIRRFNEIHHRQKIQKHLKQFSSQMQRSEMIVVHAPGPNLLILLEEERIPVDKLRRLCVNTKKAKFEQVVEAFESIQKVTFLA